MRALLLLALVAVASLANASFPKPPIALTPRVVDKKVNSHSALAVVQKQLEVRGGAGPLEAELAAKILAMLYVAHGAVMIVSPDTIMQIYEEKYSGPNEAIEVMTESSGFRQLGVGVLAYCLLVQKTDLNAAIALSTLPQFLTALKWNLSGQGKGVGLSDFATLHQVILTGVVLYGASTRQGWVQEVTRAVTILFLVNGSLAAILPTKFLELWDIKTSDKRAPGAMKSAGHWNICYNAAMLCVLNGMDPAKALAYGSISGIVFFIMGTYVTKEMEAYGVNKMSMNFWTLVFAVLIGSILS